MTSPPSTLRAWPVMYSERGDTRNPTTLATSTGRSMRPRGICRTRRRVNSSGDWLSSAACSRATDVHMSVSTKPGHTQFTRIPSAAWAIARLLVMLMTAALLALYGRLARLPIFLGDLERLGRAIDAGVVYENVDPPEFRARLIDHSAEIPA